MDIIKHTVNCISCFALCEI